MVALAALGAGLVHPAGATPPQRPSAAAPTSAGLALAPPSPDLPGLPPVSLDLAGVAVDSAAFRRARAAYDEVAGVLESHQARRVELDRTAASLNGRLVRVRAELMAAQARAGAARARLDALEGAIADLAVSIYTSGGPAARIDAALATAQPATNDADRRDVLASASMDVLLAERATRVDELARAQRAVRAGQAEQTAILGRQRSLQAERPDAMEAEVAAAPAVATARVAYEDARVLARVRGAEFPLVALDAYYRAAATIAVDDARCALRWWAIAGIARVEGHHGTYGGASLTEVGDTTKRIIGIRLDGTNRTRVIGDSDGGALDGDPVYDRAVGPMQFIPQTWSRFASDGNADGVATPFNLYDATLAAARYLCRSGRDLDTDAGLRRAYFSYNHSEAYVERVLSFARHYERAVDLRTPRD